MSKPNVVVYSKDNCPFCVGVKNLLEGKNVTFKEVNVSSDQAALDEIVKKTGHQTVPQVFVDGRFIGGFQELQALDQSGKLDQILR